MAVLGSLRVRLPLVFLAGILLAGVITTLIAVRLFHQFAHDQALTKLSREANGVAQLYAHAVNQSYAYENGKKSTDLRAPSKFVAAQLEKATGDRIYFMGPRNSFPGQRAAVQGPLRYLSVPATTFDWISGQSGTFTFVPPGGHVTYYG
ncbi:MAG TPA: hypothetical protein VF094_05615, partial [Gaiellaceae bacterium]